MPNSPITTGACPAKDRSLLLPDLPAGRIERMPFYLYREILFLFMVLPLFQQYPFEMDSVLTRASFLELRPTGLHPGLRHFDYGNWALKGQDLYLTNQHHTTYIFRLLAVGKRKWKFTWQRQDRLL